MRQNHKFISYRLSKHGTHIPTMQPEQQVQTDGGWTLGCVMMAAAIIADQITGQSQNKAEPSVHS